LLVSREQFRKRPQTGTACRATWREFGQYLARPVIGVAKDAAGAVSPALYEGNVRQQDRLVRIWGAVRDFHARADVAEAAERLPNHSATVPETSTSPGAAPRCRASLALADPIDAGEYRALHAIVRAHLRPAGVAPDEQAKDASRCSY